MLFMLLWLKTFGCHLCFNIWEKRKTSGKKMGKKICLNLEKNKKISKFLNNVNDNCLINYNRFEI